MSCYSTLQRAILSCNCLFRRTGFLLQVKFFCLILSSFLTFLTQKELPRALWCPVASSSTSMMTARHTQCTWRVCECVGPSCFFHAERFECSKHTLGGCCCCCTKCLRVQLQVVLAETTENVHDTMQQHSSLHTGPVSIAMEARLR